MSYVPPHQRNRPAQKGGNERFTRDNNNNEGQDRRSTQDRRGGNNQRGQDYSGGDIRHRSFNSGGYKSRAQRELSLEPDAEIEMELFGKKSAQVAQGINFDEYEKIPVDISGMECPAPIDHFDELLQNETLLNNIARCKFLKPTPIQKYSIPTVLQNRDLMACAQTGSGKTGAFLIPTIEMLLLGGHQPNQRRGGSRSQYYPLALVLAPTRELAQQIHTQCQKMMYMSGMRACCVYGGSPIKDQFDDMSGGVHIIVATPGRLLDMYERKRLSLSRIQFLIMDEADRMLDMGFEPQIRQIIGETDMNPQRRTLMFSATFPDEIQELAQIFLDNYIFLAVGRVGSTTALITQRVMYVLEQDKMATLFQVLPQCDGNILVFTATKRQADNVEYNLRQRGFDAITIHGNKTQTEREFALDQFREGLCNVLVATDVAARGLDIPNVLWVIQFDLPSNSDDYVHRIGRTGRRGNCGTAIAFVNEANRGVASDLLRLLTENRQEIPSWFAKMVQTSTWQKRPKRGRNSRGGKESGATDFRKRAEPQTQKKGGKPMKKQKNSFRNDGW